MEENMRLYMRRAERGRLSQSRVAQKAGIAFDRYFRIEKGYAAPTEAEQAAIAAVLDAKVSELFPASVNPQAQQESR